MLLITDEVRDLLEDRYILYNNANFIDSDPISVPHRYSSPEDIEIAGFYAAVFAWGKRTTSIRKANELLALMDDTPYDFHCNARPADYKLFETFVHRTFQSVDVPFFIAGLQRVLQNYGSIHRCFVSNLVDEDIGLAIHRFRAEFFSIPHLQRTMKHLPDPLMGSASKRMNMFLRWMVRKDNMGVDFGIWDDVSPAILHCPLDVHSGRVARKLGLLERKQNDWKAVKEVSSSLRLLDANDPAKYDFALFGLGIFEGF